MILIVTIEDDIHSLAVQASLIRRGIDCRILESDKLAIEHPLHFSIGNGECAATVRTRDGQITDVASVRLIWWRHGRSTQKLNVDVSEESHFSLINNDCTGTLNGLFLSSFSGKWISNPKATEQSSNKLFQLTVAQQCGFRIPTTLVTQSESEVRRFYDRFDGKIIVKPVVGTPGPLVFTQFVRGGHLEMPDSIRICPAIYQEYIPGRRHIRLNCFGPQSFAAEIETSELDWRPNLTVPVRRWIIPPELQRRVREVLSRLGLEMGIIDLKETPSGELVWFEVNPQGQFLFLEPLTGEPLTERFADYLQGEYEKTSVAEDDSSTSRDPSAKGPI